MPLKKKILLTNNSHFTFLSHCSGVLEPGAGAGENGPQHGGRGDASALHLSGHRGAAGSENTRNGQNLLPLPTGTPKGGFGPICGRHRYLPLGGQSNAKLLPSSGNANSIRTEWARKMSPVSIK